MKLRIKKGDMVKVISGKYRNSEDIHRVLVVDPKKGKILVEGVNLRKKHEKPNPRNQKGGIVSKEMPVDYSNVMIVDSDKLATRIGINRVEKDGKRMSIRYAKTNGKDL